MHTLQTYLSYITKLMQDYLISMIVSTCRRHTVDLKYHYSD